MLTADGRPQRAAGGARRARHDGAGRAGRADRGRRPRPRRPLRGRHQPDHRREPAAPGRRRAIRCSPARSISPPPLRLEATAVGESTLLAEIVRLMELAEQRRARYVVLADRIARALCARGPRPRARDLPRLDALLGGTAGRPRCLYAVAVLIITCPCALGARGARGAGDRDRPAAAAGRAAEVGDRARAPREVDTVVFDKTGTLTRRPPEPRSPDAADRACRSGLAASLAGASRHPLARALCRAAPGVAVADGRRGDRRARACAGGEPTARSGSASRDWCGDRSRRWTARAEPELWLARPGARAARFAFADPLAAGCRPRSSPRCSERGLGVELLSGDRAPVVAAARPPSSASQTWRAACTPAR